MLVGGSQAGGRLTGGPGEWAGPPRKAHGPGALLRGSRDELESQQLSRCWPRRVAESREAGGSQVPAGSRDAGGVAWRCSLFV